MPAPSLWSRRFVANVAAGAGGRAAAIVVAFALTTVLVRTLGTGVYGTWSFFFVLLGFHAQFDLGLSVAIERAVARAAADERWSHVPALLGSGLLLAAALSALLQIAVVAWPARWLAALGDPQAVRACLLVLPACLFCSNAAAVAGAGLAGLQRTTTLALQRTVLGAIAAGAVAGLAMAGVRRLDLLLATYAASLAAAAGASAIAVARDLPAGSAAARAWWPEGAALRRAAARVGGQLQATTLVAQLGNLALRLVLGSRFGPAAMGLYDLASRAAIAPRTLVASLLVALVPFAAGRERRDGRGAFTETLWMSTKYHDAPDRADDAGGAGRRAAADGAGWEWTPRPTPRGCSRCCSSRSPARRSSDRWWPSPAPTGGRGRRPSSPPSRSRSPWRSPRPASRSTASSRRSPS